MSSWQANFALGITSRTAFQHASVHVWLVFPCFPTFSHVFLRYFPMFSDVFPMFCPPDLCSRIWTALLQGARWPLQRRLAGSWGLADWYLVTVERPVTRSVTSVVNITRLEGIGFRHPPWPKPWRCLHCWFWSLKDQMKQRRDPFVEPSKTPKTAFQLFESNHTNAVTYLTISVINYMFGKSLHPMDPTDDLSP